MADSQASVDAQLAESSEPRPRRVSDIGFDAKLAPTCMMWSMVVAIGFIIVTALLWGAANLGTLFK